jgi:hypothetical protein
MSSGHPPFSVRRLTVEAPLLEPLGDTPQEECGHEVGWYSTTDYIERCAICGTILGPVRWKPK